MLIEGMSEEAVELSTSQRAKKHLSTCLRNKRLCYVTKCKKLV